MRRVKVRSFNQHDRSLKRQKNLHKGVSLNIVRVKRIASQQTRQNGASLSEGETKVDETPADHSELNVGNDSIVDIDMNDTPRVQAVQSTDAETPRKRSFTKKEVVLAAPHVTISMIRKHHRPSKNSSFATTRASPDEVKPSSDVPAREEKNPQKKSARQLVYQLPSASKAKTTDQPDQGGKDNRNTLRRRRRKGCFGCSACCCVGLILGALLLLIGLAALLVALLLNKTTTTTKTSTSTSTPMTSTTSVTTTTETTTTATTTTTTTSQTTTTTSTSATSTTSTATTVTTTSVTTSTSTSATTTTATTTTATTSTSETTTTPPSTTTTTPTPPCLPTPIGSSSILYTTASSSNVTYNCYTYNWTASTTGAVTLTFEMRHDPDYWYLDDVAVFYFGTNMIVNGGFETGSLSPWVRSTPNGPCTTGAPAAVQASGPFTGSYALLDGSNGCNDQVSQSFVVTAGQDFIVSFWLRSGSLGAVVTANVTLF